MNLRQSQHIIIYHYHQGKNVHTNQTSSLYTKQALCQRPFYLRRLTAPIDRDKTNQQQ